MRSPPASFTGLVGTGRLALVTGGSRGLGGALASELVARGSRVVAVSRRPERQDGSTDLLVPVATDLSDSVQVAELAKRVARTWGTPDVVINAAGAAAYSDLAHTNQEAISATIRLNLIAPLVLISALLPAMVSRGTGAVVTVSSLAALTPMTGLGVYGASKAALDAASISLRRELCGSGVTTLLVRPGRMATTFFEEAGFPREERGASEGYVDPVTVAGAIIANIGRNGEYVVPADRRFVMLHRYFPVNIANRIAHFKPWEP